MTSSSDINTLGERMFMVKVPVAILQRVFLWAKCIKQLNIFDIKLNITADGSFAAKRFTEKMLELIHQYDLSFTSQIFCW